MVRFFFLTLFLIAFSSFHLVEKQEKITVLFTNDLHSRVEAFSSQDSKYPGMGGFAERAAVVNKIRAESKNVILLDAGDVFQGTPYFNLWKGEVEYKIMSAMKYDAVNLGNHEFDNGVGGIVDRFKFANFPILNSNYDFSSSELKDRILPYLILERSGVRIGVYGLCADLKGLVSDSKYENIKYGDPIKAAKEFEKQLKNKYHCQIVLCLSHLGYSYKDEQVSDSILARNTTCTDAILGGHTHTLLTTPIAVKNKIGKKVLIAQNGWGGANVCRIDFYVNNACNSPK